MSDGVDLSMEPTESRQEILMSKERKRTERMHPSTHMQIRGRIYSKGGVVVMYTHPRY